MVASGGEQTSTFSMQRFRLDGRRALVTGGATGIGRAISVALATAGADVAVTYRSHKPDDVLAEIEAQGRAATAVPIDFSSFSAAQADTLVEDVHTQLGGLDILVNNAGTIVRTKAEDFAESDWRQVREVNLDAVWLTTQAAGRRMLEAEYGRIIMVASVLGFRGGILVAPYTAAKHALVGITKTLSNEWASRGVTVNALAPGYTVTDNTAPLRADPARNAAISNSIPAGRWGTPADMAGATVFLASDAASYVSGHTLAVDGGWLGQ